MSENQKTFFTPIKKFWNFLWKEDSWLSWIVFIVLVYILIKFIFFPTMSFLTGTALPLAIVESCSMHHNNGNFDSWWNNNGQWYADKNIEKQTFEAFPIKNGFSKGDIFFVLGVKKSDIKVGDVILFMSGNKNRVIIHRVVNLNPLETKGDNNALQFTKSNNAEQIDETNIKEEQIVGRVTSLRVPLLGWLKLIFYEPFRNPAERGFCK